MIKRYKMTRIVRNVEAIQLKEDNIIEVARFLDSGYFVANSNNDGIGKITGLTFNVEKGNHLEAWELDIDFSDYVVKIDGEIEGYSEKDFKQLFEEEK